MRYAFNSTNPVGHRLLSASSASGAPIDPCKMYNVVTTNYVAAGGDGYNLVAEALTLEANGAGHELVVIEMVKAHTPVRRAGKGSENRWRLTACNVLYAQSGELGIGVTKSIEVQLKGLGRLESLSSAREPSECPLPLSVASEWRWTRPH